MQVDLSSLPDSVQLLIDQLKQERDEYRGKYEAMRRKVFGRSSEKLDLSEEDQARLFNEPERATEAVETKEVKGYKRKKSKKKKERKPQIPDNLPEVSSGSESDPGKTAAKVTHLDRSC